MLRFLIFAWVMVGLAALVAPMLDGRRVGQPGIMPASSGETPEPVRTEEPGTVSRGEVTVIRRDSTGQFHLEVDVGGAQITFLIDTGADVVALTKDDAQALGITPDEDSYRPILRTASGTGMAATVQLERMSIAGRDLDNVQAVVVPDLPVSLLGQSALRRLGSVTLQGDRLIIAG
jgi:aspartyl protease family protein